MTLQGGAGRILHKKATGFDTGFSLSAAPFFPCLSFSFQVFQFFFNIFTEFYLADQNTAGPARNTFCVQLHAVFSIKIKILAGKCHNSVPSLFRKVNFHVRFPSFFFIAPDPQWYLSHCEREEYCCKILYYWAFRKLFGNMFHHPGHGERPRASWHIDPFMF
jgi:hypothetical protein